MTLGFAAIWRIARRDLSARIRGLRLLAICLFLGVATLAAIGSLTAGIADELSQRGQSILGGDLQIETAQRMAAEEELAAFRKVGELSETVRLRAMAIGGDDSVLAELKAVDGAYPFYGKFLLNDGSEASAPAQGSVYIARAMANRLSLKTGDNLRFGDKNFAIKAIIAQEPDRLGEGFALGPVAIINLKDLPATSLIQPGSMFNAKYRIKLPRARDPGMVAQELGTAFPAAGWEVTDRSNGAPSTRRFVERMGQFLTLVGLAALVIAGIGVGNGVSSYLESKRASIATLKVTGADSMTIFKIYLMQIFTVAALAISVGLLIGAIAPSLISVFIGDLLPVPEGFNFYLAPLLASAAYGLLIALTFSLPPLARARTVPAAGLFRAVVDKPKRMDLRTAIFVAIAIGAIVTLAVAGADEPLFSLGFIGAAFALLLLLAAIAWAVRKIAARIPRPANPLPRLALANLHRPGAQTGALVIALGLGLTLFVTLAAVQTSISNEISRSVPERAPSFFVLDIPKERSAEFSALIRKNAAGANINMIPALRGSITEFGGQRVAELDSLPEGAWVLRGDRGLTYSPALPAGSTLTAGEWWAQDYRGPPLVSIEQDVAASLDISIGDSLTISVLGVELQAKVASLRSVDWDNFGLNYVLVFSPGSFDNAPHNMVATLTMPKAQEAAVARALPPVFPSASLLEVGEIVGQVTILLTQMARAIAAAASIAILAGIAVLVGAIAASRAGRIYDSVILKLLGATRRQILGAQALEYALLSVLLGIVALGLGMGAGWYVITQIFDFTFAPDPATLAVTLIGGAGLTFLLGMAGSLPILAAKPAEALRSL
ncbi:MAG: FtsX-like permease family protein [Sphingorhabdus sp.]